MISRLCQNGAPLKGTRQWNAVSFADLARLPSVRAPGICAKQTFGTKCMGRGLQRVFQTLCGILDLKSVQIRTKFPAFFFLFQSPALLLEPKNTTFLLTYTVCHNSFREQYFKDIFLLLMFIMILSFWVSKTSQGMSCAFFSYVNNNKKKTLGRVFPPSSLALDVGTVGYNVVMNNVKLLVQWCQPGQLKMLLCREGFMTCSEMCLPRGLILSIASSNMLSKVKTGKHFTQSFKDPSCLACSNFSHSQFEARYNLHISSGIWHY